VYAAPVYYQRSSSKATTSLVMGIMGIIILPIVFSLLAIIFAAQAKTEIDRNPAIQGGGKATAGMVLGIVGLAAWAIILIAIMSASGGSTY
jgi:hypothetical protein